VVVLMPPLSISREDLTRLVDVTAEAIDARDRESCARRST
jgi:adenosylmethionine-8-amino-7-oxononanoate aminotransferase